MAKEKTTNCKVTISPKMDESGKAELKVRVDIDRTNRPQFRTGIFITPSIFFDGELYTDDKTLKAEVSKASSRLDAFISAVKNIVKVFKDAAKKGRFQEEINKDLIDRILRLKDGENFNLDLTEASFNEINDELVEEEKRVRSIKAAEDARKAEEEARKAEEENIKKRKSLIQYVLDYSIAHELSEGRSKMFKSLSRTLMRFELYNRIVLGINNYKLVCETLTIDDLLQFKDFLKNEVTLIDKYPEEFKTITKAVNESISVKDTKSIKPRGANHIADTLKRLGSVIKWACKQNKIMSPLDELDKMSDLYGKTRYSTPVCLNRGERIALAKFDLSGNKRLETYRDIFILQCLCGARYGDLSKFRHSDIVDGILDYIPSKTRDCEDGEDQVEPKVPLCAEALKLIDKYKGVDNDGRLMPFPSLNAMNENLPTIFKMCGLNRNVKVRNSTSGMTETKPLYELASTHLARRSFINVLRRGGVALETISSMSGHRPNSKSIARYYDDGGDEARKAATDLL